MQAPGSLLADPGIECADGSRVMGAAVVLAGPVDTSLGLLGHDASQVQWSSTRAFHFCSDTPVLDDPLIVLNGSGEGHLNWSAVRRRWPADTRIRIDT